MSKYNGVDPHAAANPYVAHAKLINFVGADKKVLEVGCATGSISRVLKRNRCSVIGIEIDPKSAEHARKYCDDVIVGDVESVELPYKDGFFDVIMFGDVLEHTINPLMVLKRLKRYLRDDGYIVVSIPNVANYVIRLKLLLGKFEYQEGGILDRSHLQFFTLRTAKRLITDAGFRIVKFDVTPSLPLFIPNWLRYRIAKTFPSLFAFQFLILASKKKYYGVEKIKR